MKFHTREYYPSFVTYDLHDVPSGPSESIPVKPRTDIPEQAQLDMFSELVKLAKEGKDEDMKDLIKLLYG